MLGSRYQIRKYVKYLLLKHGVGLEEVEVHPCRKGFRYGNSQLEETKICVVVPTYRGGVMYVIGGMAPILVGRPVLEKLQIAGGETQLGAVHGGLREQDGKRLVAGIYVPGKVNGMSVTKGFTPTQWVMGRSPNQVQSLTGDLFSPSRACRGSD